MSAAITTAMELKRNCPECGKPQQSNGQITWCEQGHVFKERTTMLVWAVPQRVGACRSCNAPIIWVMTEKRNKWHPMESGFDVIGREGALSGMLRVYRDQSHFANCPNSKRHRKGGGR